MRATGKPISFTDPVGDAAHPTSPYAAYGAGMAIEDGYYLGRRLAGLDLRDHAAVRAALDAFEAPRKPHTARQVQQAYILGKVFHHAPGPLRGARDAILDRTPFLQKVVGESSPGEILAQIAAIDETERQFATIRGDVPIPPGSSLFDFDFECVVVVVVGRDGSSLTPGQASTCSASPCSTTGRPATCSGAR